MAGQGKQLIVICIALCLVNSVGLLWSLQAVGSDGQRLNSTLANFTFDDMLANEALAQIPHGNSLAQEVRRNLGGEANLGRLWHGLLELRVGNQSLKSMKDGLLSATESLSPNCAYDMLRAVENMAATGFYATACHLDHYSNMKNTSDCFASHASPLLWASNLFDSWGKPPAGVASSGPFFLMGDFDQCLAISIPPVPTTASTTALKLEKTQYCRADIHTYDASGNRSSTILTYGICVPNTCSRNDVQHFINFWTRDLMSSALGYQISSGSDITCYHKDDDVPWKISEIIFLSVIALLLITVAAGTIFDACSVHKPNLSERRPLALHRHRRQRAGKDEQSEAEAALLSNAHLPVGNYFKDLNGEKRMEAGKCKSSYKDDLMSIVEDELSVVGAPSVALTYKAGDEVRDTFTHTSIFTDILNSFSIRRSMDHLLRESGSQIRSFHGIKVISAIWVIVGHSFLLSLGYIGNPKHLVKQIQALWMAQWFFNSSLSVDSFFLMAGAVLAFSFRRRLISAKNDETRLNNLFALTRWLIVYIHRWLRLLPTYAFVLGVTAFVFNRFGSGPMWNQTDGVFGSKCNSNDWWRHLFFVLNYFPTECMPWMWYLSLDMQFYLLSPFCLFLLYKASPVGRSLIGLIVVASGLYRLAIYSFFDFPSNIILKMLEKETIISDEAAKMFGLLYAAPQARVAPFVIGIFLGWSLAVKKSSIFRRHPGRNCKSSPFTILGLQALSIGLLTWALHGSDIGFFNNKMFEKVYASQFRIAWSLGLALLVWLCERGHFKPLSTILGWDKWVPVSRLCFGIYLSHELIIIASIYQRRRVWMVENPMEVVTFALGVAVLSLICALILAIFVELPPLTLERKLFMRIRKNISIRRNDDGNLTVGSRSVCSSKPKRRLGYPRSDSTCEEPDDTPAPEPVELPQIDLDAKVMDWLEKTEEDVTKQDLTEEHQPTDSCTKSEVTADCNIMYPWDNASWNSDSRLSKTVLASSCGDEDEASATRSPNVDSSSHTQLLDTQEIVKSEKSHIARIIHQETSNADLYKSTDA